MREITQPREILHRRKSSTDLSRTQRSLPWMTFNALEHRNIAKVHRMLKRLVRLVAELAFMVGKSSEINRMLEGSGSHILLGWSSGIVDHGVADVAVISNHPAAIANVFAVMTAETA